MKVKPLLFKTIFADKNIFIVNDKSQCLNYNNASLSERLNTSKQDTLQIVMEIRNRPYQRASKSNDLVQALLFNLGTRSLLVLDAMREQVKRFTKFNKFGLLFVCLQILRENSTSELWHSLHEHEQAIVKNVAMRYNITKYELYVVRK